MCERVVLGEIPSYGVGIFFFFSRRSSLLNILSIIIFYPLYYLSHDAVRPAGDAELPVGDGRALVARELVAGVLAVQLERAAGAARVVDVLALLKSLECNKIEEGGENTISMFAAVGKLSSLI